MKFEELNEVRVLKGKITQAVQKVKALEACIKPSSIKYTRDIEYDKDGKRIGTYPCLDTTPRAKSVSSPTEVLAVMLADEKSELSNLQKRLTEAIPELTKKIQTEITDNIEQTLIIYRYVACEYFRDIGFKMGYSERWVYLKHNQILKRFSVDCSRGSVI